MSLLRAIPRSLPKANLIVRTLATQTHDAPVVSREKSPSTEITPQQPKEVLAAEVISGAPGAFWLEMLCGCAWTKGFFCSVAELRHRQVRIYVPTRNTMQSGGARGERWRIDFDILQGGGRWENQLMGWASSCVRLFLTAPWLPLTGFLQCGL
jgi:NADH dehydrogenase (ubiquinone) Fe-S protein 4